MGFAPADDSRNDGTNHAAIPLNVGAVVGHLSQKLLTRIVDKSYRRQPHGKRFAGCVHFAVPALLEFRNPRTGQAAFYVECHARGIFRPGDFEHSAAVNVHPASQSNKCFAIN